MKIQVFIFTKSLFLFVYLFFLSGNCNSQSGQLDSLRTEANILAYSNPELAIEKALKLYSLAKNDPATQISALLIVANGYAVLKKHDEVLEYAFKADSIAKKTNNHIDRIRVLGFIGGQYQRLKLSEKALNYLDQAYETSLAHPLPDSLEFLQGNILFVKGLIQKDNLGCEYSLEYFKKAAEVFKRNTSNKTLNSSVAIASNKIGDCNFELNLFKEARLNYEEAILYAGKIDATKSMAYAEMGLAKILAVEGENDKAIELLQNALKAVADINDLGINSDIFNALSENYLAVGDTENYNKYTAFYLAEQEKLLSEENRSLNKVANDLASENLERREEQKNKYTYLFLLFGIILILVIAYVTHKIFAKRRKIALHKAEMEKSSKN